MSRKAEIISLLISIPFRTDPECRPSLTKFTERFLLSSASGHSLLEIVIDGLTLLLVRLGHFPLPSHGCFVANIWKSTPEFWVAVWY